jgi:hypothetical protein
MVKLLNMINALEEKVAKLEKAVAKPKATKPKSNNQE